MSEFDDIGPALAQLPDSNLTVGALRQLLEDVPPDTQVVVGIRDEHRFNVLIGELTVRKASVQPGLRNPIVVLQVASLT